MLLEPAFVKGSPVLGHGGGGGGECCAHKDHLALTMKALRFWSMAFSCKSMSCVLGPRFLLRHPVNPDECFLLCFWSAGGSSTMGGGASFGGGSKKKLDIAPEVGVSAFVHRRLSALAPLLLLSVTRNKMRKRNPSLLCSETNYMLYLFALSAFLALAPKPMHIFVLTHAHSPCHCTSFPQTARHSLLGKRTRASCGSFPVASGLL